MVQQKNNNNNIRVQFGIQVVLLFKSLCQRDLNFGKNERFSCSPGL